MSEEQSQMPGYWKFLWMFWMQPVTLHYRLKICGIEEPGAPGWKLLRAVFRGGVVERAYLQRMAGTLAFGFPFAGIVFVSLRAAGVVVNFEQFALAVVASVAWGIALSIAWSIGWGVAWGAVLSVVLGFFLSDAFSAARASASNSGIFRDIFLSLYVGVPLGIGWGVARAVARTVARGVALDVAPSMDNGVIFLGVALGAVWGIAGAIVTDSSSDVGLGIIVLCIIGSVITGVSFWLAVNRVPFYCLEVVAQFAFYFWQRAFATPTLQAGPVLHHELSYFPYPFLAQHILLSADRDPVLARRVIEACAVAPGQREAGKKVLGQLQVRELEKKLRARRFSEVAELRGTWLSDADPLLLVFAEAARYLASAAVTSVPFHRLKKLELAEQQCYKLRRRLLVPGSPLAHALRSGPLSTLEQVIADLCQHAKAGAHHHLPNPYRAGEPLSLEEGKETFRGREGLVRSIETLLGEPGRGASIALLGPRRCGKTSLLKMLPHLLPDAAFVLFDLQDNPIDSPASLFTALERRAREQVRRDRQIYLPKLPAGAPFEAGSRWLEALDAQAGPLRILFCLDEFERLESLFPGSRRELLQVMGLLRATIQHRRRIRLLVSGAAPFDELDAMWNDHFINMREVKIGFLDEEAAVGLLRKPIPEFPEEAVPQEVAQAIVARTGGQPYLVQLYGSLLVTRLNQEERRRADLGDVPRVEEQVLQQATYYLRNTWQEAPPAAQAALLDPAHDGTPNLDAATRRWLRRRLLLTEEGRLSIPVLGAWLRAEEAE